MKRAKAPGSFSPDELLMVGYLMGDSGAAIEVSEQQGQRELCESSQLPIKGSEDPTFVAMGIRFGEPTDDLFREATLPKGWELRPTEHSMWSDLVDAAGNVRAKVFFKAAFYDRRANMLPVCRYRVGIDYNYKSDTNKRACVFDSAAGDKAIFTSTESVTEEIDQWDAMTLAETRCKRWLDEHYPDWANAAAYWDESEGT